MRRSAPVPSRRPPADHPGGNSASRVEVLRDAPPVPHPPHRRAVADGDVGSRHGCRPARAARALPPAAVRQGMPLPPLRRGEEAAAVGLQGRSPLRRLRQARHHRRQRRCRAVRTRRALALRHRGEQMQVLADRPLEHPGRPRLHGARALGRLLLVRQGQRHRRRTAPQLPRRRATGRRRPDGRLRRHGEPRDGGTDQALRRRRARLRGRHVLLAGQRLPAMPEHVDPREPLAVSRRRLLQLATAAFTAWQVAPWVDRLEALAGPPGGTTSDAMTTTLEAFADTLIPGEKRFDGDVAVAGVVRGPGAVQAGAVDLMWFPAAAIGPALPTFVSMLDGRATSYAVQHRVAVDPTLPAFVALGFADRTRLCLELLDPASRDYLLWWALAAMPFLAFHTAGHLHTAEAVRRGHPGLRALRFPQPDADGLWRFPHFSYRRRLARSHPHTTSTGNPRRARPLTSSSSAPVRVGRFPASISPPVAPRWCFSNVVRGSRR